MDDFIWYLKLGWQHIISTDALDHQLFILALSAIYLLRNWREVLVLVTAFTMGHSLTLALSVYNLFTVSAAWVEFLIPCTIIATALLNFFQKKGRPPHLKLNYLLALLFGLVHGLGFANTIRFMLADGQSIVWPLLGFNIGLELGQLLVVAGILLLAWAVVDRAKLNQKWWVWALSAVSFIWAVIFAWQRLP
jgi:HupE / UreJ protein